jgi:galactose mutarotase-like enzyme
LILLRDGDSHAAIDLLGGELRAWSVAGAPLIWTPDPAIWSDTAPILFPVVGWTRGVRVVVDGQSYPLGLHGFARVMPFAVLEQGPAQVRLELRSSAETRRLYPFDWALEIEYVLAGSSIETILTIRNTGSTSMPYACGLHPGFCWPFAGGALDEYQIVFAEREATSVPIISPDGLFTHQTRRVPLDGRRLALSPALLEAEALCFLEARSAGLRFAHASGAAIDIALTDFPHIALWSRPIGRFLCIEAWTGHGDRVDSDGDLSTKPSMRHLRPGQAASHAAKFSYAAAHLLFR